MVRSGIVIPKGKLLRIRQSEKNVVSQPMVLDEPVTVNLNSSFGPIVKQGGTFSRAVDVVGALVGQFTDEKASFGGQFVTLGLHIWEGTDPITINVTVTFHIDKTDVNALEQVVIPTETLAAIPLPDTGGFEIDQGKFTSVLDKIAEQTLVAPGPTAAALINKDEGYNVYSIEIGQVVRLEKAIIKKAEPTWATETDERGYPIWSKVNLDIQSVYTGTKGQVVRHPR
jgi:hypothetical protein